MCFLPALVLMRLWRDIAQTEQCWKKENFQATNAHFFLKKRYISIIEGYFVLVYFDLPWNIEVNIVARLKWEVWWTLDHKADNLKWALIWDKEKWNLRMQCFCIKYVLTSEKMKSKLPLTARQRLLWHSSCPPRSGTYRGWSSSPWQICRRGRWTTSKSWAHAERNTARREGRGNESSRRPTDQNNMWLIWAKVSYWSNLKVARLTNPSHTAQHLSWYLVYRLISILSIFPQTASLLSSSMWAYHDGKYDPQAYASGECPSRNEAKDTGVGGEEPVGGSVRRVWQRSEARIRRQIGWECGVWEVPVPWEERKS